MVVSKYSDRRRRADVVSYWRAVELFSPQRIPDLQREARVVPVQHNRPLPWESRSGLPQPRKRSVWQHTVYCGVFPLERVRDILADVFPDAAEADRDGWISGSSALMSFTVNAEGLLLKNSVRFSECAWAVGRTRNPGPGDRTWLDGFADEAAHCGQRMLDLGDAKLTVRGGNPRASGLLATAGKLVADAMTAGAASGLSTLVGGLAGKVVEDVAGERAGEAAESAAGTAVGAFTEDTADLIRGAGADDSTVDPADGGAGRGTDQPTGTLGAHPITVPDIAAFTSWVAERFGVTADLAPDAARIDSFQVRADRAGEAAGHDMLNSFVADDLARVEKELAHGRAGRALTGYLTGSDDLDAGRRHDVRREPDSLLEGVSPEHVPLGRWPEDTSRPLALSQQFAVNSMLRELRRSAGLFSVNGPPGTGKTTMLRDVIAALITERACVLAELRNPADAFGKRHTWRGAQYTRTVHEIRPELADYAMVVASANNGAVENITEEVPSVAAIAAQWRQEAAYLPEQARLLLDGQDAWGAIAARLGKRSNRRDFVQRFWWGSEQQSHASQSGADGPKQQPSGLHALLTGHNGSPDPAPDWATAVRDFCAARQKVERLREERQSVARALRDLPGAQRAADRLSAQTAGSEERFRELNQLVEETRAETRRLASEQHECATRLAHHRQRRPGAVRSLFTGRQARRRWQQEEERLAAEVDRSAAAALRVQQQGGEYLREAHNVERRMTVAQEKRQAADRLATALRDARKRWGPHVPDLQDFAPDADQETAARRELTSPWADEEFTSARTQVFLAALRLHQAFLSAAGKPMLGNLRAAMDVIGGEAPADIEPAAVRAAWQNFFLTIPVVSTTFASFDRLFAGLQREDLGWLFVDEAGQAAPQLPVGALWRSRRGVLVGDPLQLQPVVVLPWTAQQRLREHHGVAQEWAPARTSAQQVADRLARWGTALPAPLPDLGGDDTEQVWVGSPLRVHRRCDDPMFTISNEVAYDGLMVHGVVGRGDFRPPRESFWWDVRVHASSGPWIPAEGEALATAVTRLCGEGLRPDQLFVLSPFREVAQQAADRLHRLDVPRDRVGTIHTAQGKEADVVLIVLGTDRAAVRSRSWAAQRPNLLNVAVSRAKRRVIVIGDRDAWRRQPYFGVLARQLRYFSWR